MHLKVFAASMHLQLPLAYQKSTSQFRILLIVSFKPHHQIRRLFPSNGKNGNMKLLLLLMIRRTRARRGQKAYHHCQLLTSKLTMLTFRKDGDVVCALRPGLPQCASDRMNLVQAIASIAAAAESIQVGPFGFLMNKYLQHGRELLIGNMVQCLQLYYVPNGLVAIWNMWTAKSL